jgi:hypothetical protein
MTADLEVTQGSVSYAQVEGEPLPWWNGMDDMSPIILGKSAQRNQWQLAANFNFDVTMEEMVTLVGGTKMVKDETKVVRPVRTWRGGANDGQVDLLGRPFSEDYGLVTPGDVLDFAESLVQLANDSGQPAYLANLGSVRNGNRMFASVNLGDINVTAPNGYMDTTRGYLSISNTFDGTSPFVVSNDDIRIVCANTQRMVLRNVEKIVRASGASLRGSFISGRAVRLRHTKRIADRMQEAVKAIAEHNKWKTAYELYAAKLMETKMTDAAFTKMVKALALKDGDDTTTTNQNDRKTATLNAGWKVENQRTGKNAWSALNAFTDLASHSSIAKGTQLSPMAQLEVRHGFANNATLQTQTLIDDVNDYLARVLVKA